MVRYVRFISFIMIIVSCCHILTGCADSSAEDKDFSALTSPSAQEEAYEYKCFYIPGKDNGNQPYVGDTMPYYEDGTYYIYYLKEGGDSFHHSVYLMTTRDFVTYEEYETPALEAAGGAQDDWIGTGSVVKVGDVYYFFYTGHTTSPAYEYNETIMLAKGTSPYEFEKVSEFEIVPPEELNQKRDFRDPQGYYDEVTGEINLTVTASQDGTARILKYTVDKELQDVRYDGIIFSNPVGDFWNLECSDTFCIGDRYYLTYSAQDDTLWYAVSDAPYGPYSQPRRLEGKLFYAAKHVESSNGAYMVGWARRSESPTDTISVTGWAGNLLVQQIRQLDNGDLVLEPVEAIADRYTKKRKNLCKGNKLKGKTGQTREYTDAFTAYESFMLKGSFCCRDNSSLGLAFDYNGDPSAFKTIEIDPLTQSMSLRFNGGNRIITETMAPIKVGETYSFTYIQEGSVGVFYIDGIAALTVRLYGVSGKPVRLYMDGEAEFSGLEEYTP